MGSGYADTSEYCSNHKIKSSPGKRAAYERDGRRLSGRVKDGLKYYERMGFAKRNAGGIEATLSALRDRYASPS